MAVYLGSEPYALGSDFAHLCEGEYLVASAVGEDRAIPLHEVMESFEFLQDFDAGSLGEVIGVGKDDVCAEGAEFIRGDVLDCAACGDGHEKRGRDGAVRSFEDSFADSCLCVGFVAEDGHRVSLRINASNVAGNLDKIKEIWYIGG